jgi:mRNA-degrading endonuclease RelE of RelBE toxin-antitoxin system
MATSWKIEILPAAEKDLDALDDALRREALEAILDLAEAPTPPDAIELRGLRNHYRIAFGNRRYRIVYRLSKRAKTIFVIRVRPRSTVYIGYPRPE